MNDWIESYKILEVKVGAGMSDITDSYRRLCRIHHPDVSENPDSEEQMKRINIAYTVLRERFGRQSKSATRHTYARPQKRYSPTEQSQKWQSDERQQRQGSVHTEAKEQKPKQTAEDLKRQEEENAKRAEQAKRQQATYEAVISPTADAEARQVISGYFEALNAYDFAKAYTFLSEHDKKFISHDAFAKWRESVAKLYPMREFEISKGSSVAMVTWDDDSTLNARKFKVNIKEDDMAGNSSSSGGIEKLVINEDGNWGIFLGYKSVEELVKTFDERFETKKKKDFQKRWEEFHSGHNADFNMLNLKGMQKPISKEIYRQRRYGGSITLAVISVKLNDATELGNKEILRSAARTINAELRETDISGYAGGGVFVIFFSELRIKDAEEIVDRLAQLIRKNAGSQLGNKAVIDYEHKTWSDSVYPDFDNLNEVLEKFGKKI